MQLPLPQVVLPGPFQPNPRPAGGEVGYALPWWRKAATAPRPGLASIVGPGSPAANAGLQRGDMLVGVDGIDFVNTSDSTGIARINAAPFSLRRILCCFFMTFPQTQETLLLLTNSANGLKIVDEVLRLFVGPGQYQAMQWLAEEK